MCRAVIIASLIVLTSSVASVAEERAEPRRFRLGGAAAAATGGAECVTPSAAATLGYHFSRRAGIELEIAYVPSLVPHLSGMNHQFRLSSPAPARRLMVATANLRGEMPSRVQWLLPYVVGGVGLANVRTRALTPATDDALALTAGGGIELKVFNAMWIDVGVRYQRIVVATEDLNIARFGTGVSYRF